MPMAELDTEPEFWFGDPLLDDLRGTSRVEARVALAVIAEVDAGDLGLRARELLPGLPQESGGAIPDWVAELGEAVITDAAVMYEDVFDDACTVFVEARHPSGEVHAVGILIDNNLGGMAKDILLADSIDRVEEIVREHPQPDGVVKARADRTRASRGQDPRRAGADRNDLRSSGSQTSRRPQGPGTDAC